MGIYFLSSHGNTPYNYFTRLSASFLGGEVLLSDNPPWLNELIIIDTGKYTFVNPPLPAVILLPFVAVFGQSFPQQLAAHLLGAVAVVLAYFLALSITKNSSRALWVALSLGAGSIVWFLASVGSVWYLGQITALFFVMASLAALCAKKPRVVLAGVLFALACLARTQIFLAAPFMALLINRLSCWSPASGQGDRINRMAKESRNINLIIFLFSVAAAAGVVALYNFARFGSPFETGYRFIPGLLYEPWFAQGIFHPSYIPNHLKIIFTSLPAFQREFPYILPTWWGLAIWFTSPAFVFALLAPIKNHLVKLCWGAILAIALVNFSFGSTGFTMFGYRYAVDFYPYIVLLLCIYLKNKPLTKLHWALLALSILVNTWGVVFIRLGWVV